MDKLNFGDILLLKFPFTDGHTYKRRPALLIKITMMEILSFAG